MRACGRRHATGASTRRRAPSRRRRRRRNRGSDGWIRDSEESIGIIAYLLAGSVSMLVRTTPILIKTGGAAHAVTVT
jgi:hypothetical protein